MKFRAPFFAATALVLSSLAAMAQTPANSSAEVTKIDKSSGRITLKHGEIRNLDMPPMTMVFRVVEPKMLDSVAVGDRVKFAAERIDGNFTVVTISKAP
jgi:Cu(I)/Ag(I) efflux system periplasmic protein CusF